LAIYLDASVLRGDVYGPQMSALRAIAKAAKLEVLLPELAIDEATHNREEEISTVFDGVRRSIEKARWAWPVETPDLPPPRQLAAKWRAGLAKTFRVLETRPEHAALALQREVSRTPPAKKGSGARDTAIWLTVRDDHRSRNERGFFVSANSRDFAGSNGELLETLAAELETAAQSFVLVADIASLLNRLAKSSTWTVSPEELEKADLGEQVVIAVWHDVSALPPEDELLWEAFGVGVPWTGVRTTIDEVQFSTVRRQIAYALEDKREIAVLQTDWYLRLRMQLSGPKSTIEAGYDVAHAQVIVPVEVWASRDDLSGPLQFEVSRAGPARFP
jgi:hypothetical protein